MKAVIFSPIRIFGEGLADCLNRRANITVVMAVTDLSVLRQNFYMTDIDIVLVDITQTLDLEEVRVLAAEWPNLALLALGLREQHQDVISCGRAGFTGYVARDATVNELSDAMADAVKGRLACSAEVSGHLLRALFQADSCFPAPIDEKPLTQRENDVLQLLGRGLTNKEIARELSLSISTVKHHVHKVLEKLQLPRRTYAMRRVQDVPWLATSRTLRKQQNNS
jgi:two-component system, NarL family, nitrate/nitrite response regulator NarL